MGSDCVPNGIDLPEGEILIIDIVSQNKLYTKIDSRVLEIYHWDNVLNPDKPYLTTSWENVWNLANNWLLGPMRPQKGDPEGKKLEISIPNPLKITKSYLNFKKLVLGLKESSLG